MKAQAGDKVIVTYEGRLDNNESFDSTDSSGPLEFIIGTGSVMPAFDESVIGLSEGESKTFTIAAKEAHGLSNPELIHTMKRDALPNNDKLQTGMILGLTMEQEGQQHQVPATLIALDDQQATVDFNHPLAGQALTYTVTLTTIKRENATI